MTKIINLPRDLVEEVLSRAPVTSLRKVRSTCINWNNLSKDKSFAKKHLGAQAKLVAQGKELMVVSMIDFRVYLLRVNLYNNNNVESCIKREGKVISLDNSDQIEIHHMLHWDGLLLCITKDNTRLVVWNPYWGQTRWIATTHNSKRLDRYTYALGYDKNNKTHKILRLIDNNDPDVEFKIYDFNSDTWRVLGLTLDLSLGYYNHGVSLKGNAYLFAREKFYYGRTLICFDFTKERFGPRLPLPFESYPGDIVTLSVVREEKIVVLFYPRYTLKVEIWVTTKIEPNAVSWNSKVFLSANIHPRRREFLLAARFFIDEEKQVAVVFDKHKAPWCPTRNIVYIIGVDGTLKEADLGESALIQTLFPICVHLYTKFSPALISPPIKIFFHTYFFVFSFTMFFYWFDSHPSFLFVIFDIV